MKTVKDKYRESEFINWIYDTYEISYLSRYFLNELEGVLQGTYKNLKRAIPLEDLWELWEKSVIDLRKIHDTKKRQGNEISLNSQPLYDLAIIVSRYDAFLSEKEKNKQLQEQRNDYNSSVRIDFTKIPMPHIPQRQDLTKLINGS